MEQVVERLAELVSALDGLVARIEERHLAGAGEASAERIVATVASEREEELERKLAETEAKLQALQASSGSAGRKTSNVGRMFAKDEGSSRLADALDGALGSLSVEQRIAVKAELMRAGVV